MDEKTLELLEFNVIREKVALCAASEEAARRLLADLPQRSSQETRDIKGLAAEIAARMGSGDPEPRDSLPSVGFLFPKLAVEGTALEIDEVYGLGLFVERGEAVKRWLVGSLGKGDQEDSPLRSLAWGLPDCSEASKAVFRVLDKEGNLRDLPEFREIKRRIQHLTRELESLVARYALNDDNRPILQSPLPSQRDGRTVLAVKAQFRSKIKGIVHDASGTGQTVFVEPVEGVEKNNEILLERRNLQAEIARVIRETTEELRSRREDLLAFHEGILHLETLRARARYGFETKGRFADCSKGREVILTQARHPLLGGKAVPLDFGMEEQVGAVIITGPNAGGKTAALKTAGLFALMNQFGLALPGSEGTALPVFSGIYADIGDDQSLSQSLSTFSARMSRIAEIARKSAGDSLVLLDELGSGTDPEEGGALGAAVLDYFIEKQTRLIVTTHHGILKHYGYTHEKAENASMEFDDATRSPVYRLLMGVPGESRALEAAARSGVPPEMISRARSYLDEGHADVSALIAGLKRKREELIKAEELRKQEELRLREDRRGADLRELRLRQKEAELKAAGAGALRGLLEESRKTLENLVREVREGELTREKTLKVKDFLRRLEEAAAEQDRSLEKEQPVLDEEGRRFEREYGETAAEERTIQPGMEVSAGAYNRAGTVLRMDKKKGRWIVEIGSLKMSFPEKDLRPLVQRKSPNTPQILPPDVGSPLAPQWEISLRGMHLEEALDALRRQLDAAVLSGLQEFSVVHGKGDGVLQRGVHDFLKVQPHVADYHFSRPEMGGFGRTEVVLKR
jgi:DNA mismatch repair protein MutS2